MQDLAACALNNPVVFSRAPVLLCRYKVSFLAIHGVQISDHLSSYGKRRSIGVAFLLFSFVDQSQVMVLSGCQLRGFHQHTLDMFILSS